MPLKGFVSSGVIQAGLSARFDTCYTVYFLWMLHRLLLLIFLCGNKAANYRDFPLEEL